MTRTLIVIPTRERPDNALRLEAELRKTSVEYMFCVDSNDPTLAEYDAKVEGGLLIGKPKRLGPWLNYMAQRHAHEFDILGFMGDDTMPRTENWLERIEAAMEPNGIVYPNDGFETPRVPTAAFFDAKMIQKREYWVHKSLVHLFIDDHWRELGLALNTLRYLPDVLVEHIHPYANKADWDPVYEETRKFRTDDALAYQRWLAHTLPSEIVRIKS